MWMDHHLWTYEGSDSLKALREDIDLCVMPWKYGTTIGSRLIKTAWRNGWICSGGERVRYEFKEQDAWDLVRFLGIQGSSGETSCSWRNVPYCHGGKNRKDKGSSSINLRTGQFKCLRQSCGVQGNMLTLARDFGYTLIPEAEASTWSRKTYRTLENTKEPIRPKPPAVAYLESRGISRRVAEQYEITVQTEHPNVLVFPSTTRMGICSL